MIKSLLSMQDLPCLKMDKLVSFDHGNNGMIDGFRVFVPLHHLLVQLGVGDLGANGHTTLDSLLDLADH